MYLDTETPSGQASGARREALANSPLSFSLEPGVVDAELSSAAGPALTLATAGALTLTMTNDQ